MSDPERIWLQNADDARATGDRLWCQDKVWPECDEQQEPTEYIRADLYASSISQQDAELERLRREVEEASAKIKSLVRQRDELKEEADELVVRQYEVSAQAADISRLRGALEQLVSHAERHKLDKGLISGKLYEAARDALNGVQDPLAEARKAAFIEAAEIAETLGVYPELNVFAGGPEWYKHGKAIAKVIRAKAEETGR